MTYFSSNIKLLRKRRKRSQEVVAGAIEIKRTSLSGYENGSSEPNFSILLRFSSYFKVSLDKLLKVDLGALPESQLSEIERGYDIDLVGDRMRILATTVGSDNEENIELVPHKAKAGYVNGYADPEFIKVLSTFRLPFLDKHKKYRTFQISGDSMPPVNEGSWVTGEFLQNWNLIRDGYPYIVLTKDEGIVFKILYSKIEERQTIQLCSTNPQYEPYEVHLSEIHEIWKFVNFISSELPEPNLSKDEITNTVMSLQREVKEIRNRMKDPSASLL